jgi:LPS sulfotransferase NodH
VGAGVANGRNTKFLLLTTQRSGSAWLISTMNGIPDTTAYGELFLNRPREDGVREWDAEFSYPRFIESSEREGGTRPFSVLAYLGALYGQPGSIGFKLMYDQLLRYPEILGFLLWRRIPCVHLVRENHLDVVISETLMNQTRQAHHTSHESGKGQARVVLHPPALLRRLRKVRRKMAMGRQLLFWTRLPSIEISYESLCHDPRQFDRIWEFLGIDAPSALPASNLVKMRRGRQADVVANYDEVRRALKGTAFEATLE